MNAGTTKTAADQIRHLGPCSDAVKWASRYESPEKAWEECERGDWMLWVLGKLSGESWSGGRRKLVLAACECARLALPHSKDKRVAETIETSERWAEGGPVSREEMINAANAAAHAASAADDVAYAANAAAHAAHAAAYAADVAHAANAAAHAAHAAAHATYAANAANAGAYADVAKETLGKCADIVRKHYPKPPVIKEIE